jgi:hypothetical protein
VVILFDGYILASLQLRPSRPCPCLRQPLLMVINVVYVEYRTSYDEARSSRYGEADGRHAKAKGADVDVLPYLDSSTQACLAL